MDIHGLFRRHAGVILSLVVSTAVPFAPVQAQVAVPVPAPALSSALAGCTTEADCIAAIEALVAALSAANPGVPVETIIGSVAAAVASAYNSGAVVAGVARVALASVAQVAEAGGLTQLAASVRLAVADVVAGNPIDLEAVAEGTASPA